MAMSSSGTLIVQVGPAEVGSALSDLVWLDRAGTRVSIDTSWTFRPSVQSGNVGWSISPDGKRLVIGLSSNSGEDIWIKQLPRGPLSRLTFDSGSLHRPRWTPDGRSVTYLRLSDGALLEQRADGTGTVRTLLPRGMVEGSWSRDGNWVIARTGGRAGQRGGRDIIGIRPGVDTVPRPLAANPNYDESAAALSPDGRWLAYQSDESGRSEVFIRPFPNTEGGKWQVSVNGGQSPLWAHSGRELFFVDGERRMVVTSVAVGASPDLGDRRILFPIGRDLYIGNPEFYTPFDISPDDQRFIMMRIRTPAASGQTTFVLVENWFEELKGPHDR
jgi:Tol biopolymer transport system component